MSVAEILARVAAELALFAGVGFLLFGLNDLAVDIVYFTRRFWRRHTVYKRYRRAFASYYVFNKNPGFIAIFVPAWDESAVIAQMLRSTLKRLDYPDFRIFVGHYRNDPATAAAIAGVPDERVEAVRVGADGPTTKADCLNHLYDALIAFETRTGYQPGLYRVDAGPRVSMRVRSNVSVHLDWRQRLAGAAEPGSGPAVTLGANF